MSYLPIAKRDIVTPFNISMGESASLVETTNHKASLVRQGGFHYSLTMGIRPYNLMVDSQNERYWEIVTYLAANPFFKVPLFNMFSEERRVAPDAYAWAAAGNFGTGTIVTVTSQSLPGDNTLIISLSSNTAKLRTGDFIRIGSKDKVYQVQKHENNVLTLAQPVIATTEVGDRVFFSELFQQSGHPMDGVRFSGVFGKFINEDFGNPINRIEDGIIGNIGPLSLKEKL